MNAVSRRTTDGTPSTQEGTSWPFAKVGIELPAKVVFEKLTFAFDPENLLCYYVSFIMEPYIMFICRISTADIGKNFGIFSRKSRLPDDQKPTEGSVHQRSYHRAAKPRHTGKTRNRLSHMCMTLMCLKSLSVLLK